MLILTLHIDTIRLTLNEIIKKQELKYNLFHSHFVLFSKIKCLQTENVAKSILSSKENSFDTFMLRTK